MPLEIVEIRHRLPDDDPQIVDLLNRRSVEGPPIDLNAYRNAITADCARLVAVSSGAIVGHAQRDPAWWTGDPDDIAVDLLVDHRRRGRGAGSELYRVLRETIALPCRLLTWVEQHDQQSRIFAERRGYVDTGQVIEESRLDLAVAKMEDAVELQQRLSQEGLVIEPLSRLDLTASFLDALYRVWSDSGGTASREELHRQVLEGPGLSLDTIWVALLSGAPVGMAYLKRLSVDAAESDYTTVLKSHQGRGIARALKHQSMLWAQNNGVEVLHTSSVITNHRMLAINHRVGYRPISIKCEMEAH